jgi:hypothetical protein
MIKEESCPLCKNKLVDKKIGKIISEKECIECLYTIQIFLDNSVLLIYPNKVKVFDFRNIEKFAEFIRFKVFH